MTILPSTEAKGPALPTLNSEDTGGVTSRGDEVRGIIVLAADQNVVPPLELSTISQQAAVTNHLPFGENAAFPSARVSGGKNMTKKSSAITTPVNGSSQ